MPSLTRARADSAHPSHGSCPIGSSISDTCEGARGASPSFCSASPLPQNVTSASSRSHSPFSSSLIHFLPSSSPQYPDTTYSTVYHLIFVAHLLIIRSSSSSSPSSLSSPSISSFLHSPFAFYPHSPAPPKKMNQLWTRKRSKVDSGETVQWCPKGSSTYGTNEGARPRARAHSGTLLTRIAPRKELHPRRERGRPHTVPRQFRQIPHTDLSQ